MIKEINKIKAEIEELKNKSNTIYHSGKIKSTIKTSLTLVNGMIKFCEDHVYYDDEPCNFDHHGYCQDHHTCGEDRCSNEIIVDELKQLNNFKEWLEARE